MMRNSFLVNNETKREIEHRDSESKRIPVFGPDRHRKEL